MLDAAHVPARTLLLDERRRARNQLGKRAFGASTERALTLDAAQQHRTMGPTMITRALALLLALSACEADDEPGPTEPALEANGDTRERACFTIYQCDHGSMAEECGIAWSDEAYQLSDEAQADCRGEPSETAVGLCVAEGCGCELSSSGSQVCE